MMEDTEASGKTEATEARIQYPVECEFDGKTYSLQVNMPGGPPVVLMTYRPTSVTDAEGAEASGDKPTTGKKRAAKKTAKKAKKSKAKKKAG